MNDLEVFEERRRLHAQEVGLPSMPLLWWDR